MILIRPDAIADALGLDQAASARAASRINHAIAAINGYFEAAIASGTREQQRDAARRDARHLADLFDGFNISAPGDAGMIQLAALAFGTNEITPASLAFSARLFALRRALERRAKILSHAPKFNVTFLAGSRCESAGALDQIADQIASTFEKVAPILAALVVSACDENAGDGMALDFIKQVFSPFRQPNERTAANAVRAARALSRKKQRAK